jgi:putative DNA methylase
MTDKLVPVAGPRLIERGFPCHQVGAETQRERDTGQAPPTHRLHVWWARRPLTPSRAAILASLSLPDLSPDDFLRQLGIEQRVAEIGGDHWVLSGDLAARIRRNDDGAEFLPVDDFVLRRFEREQQRRAANRKLISELEGKEPVLASNAVLQRWKSGCRPLLSQWVSKGAELLVISRAADPDYAKAQIELETAQGVRTAESKYGYERAFGAAPVLPPRRGSVLDPTAGGGSIPFEALRLGHNVVANELNPVAATILYATLDYPARFGSSLSDEIQGFGESLIGDMRRELIDLFPAGDIPAEERARLSSHLCRAPELMGKYVQEILDGFLFCRQVMCPTCGGEAPLLNSCWLAKDDNEPWAVRVIPDGGKRDGKVRFETYRVVNGRGPNGEDPNLATVVDGVGTCLHCRQAIPGDEIKAQAQGRSERGHWTDRLYCIAAVRFEPKLDKNGRPERYKSGERKGEIKTRKVRFFRAPNERDLNALAAAEARLADKWSQWEAELGHLTLVEELRQLTPEIIAKHGPRPGRAIVTYLQFVIDKAVDYNSKQTRWIPQRGFCIGDLQSARFLAEMDLR